MLTCAMSLKVYILFGNWQIASGSHTQFANSIDVTSADVRYMTGVKPISGISLCPISAYRAPSLLLIIMHDECCAPDHVTKILPHKFELVGRTHALSHTMP